MPRRSRKGRPRRAPGKRGVPLPFLEWLDRNPTPYSLWLDTQGVRRPEPRHQQRPRRR